MKRAVKAMAVVAVVLALAIAAMLLFNDNARDRLVRLFGGGDGDSASGAGSGANDAATPSSTGRTGDPGAAKPGKAADAALIDKLVVQELLKAGRVDEAEVERRVQEIVATKKRTVEVKRAEEERRVGEVVDWFDHLMAHRPESGAKAREILNEYIELRYRTYGDMEKLAIRQRVGQRLMSELPPAQGATVMKQLFI
jgi:hypothetical protein